MRKTLLVALVLLLGSLGVGMSVSAMGSTSDGNELLHVFVHFDEGAPKGLVKSLVHESGGSVTHNYSIVSAVAAQIPAGRIEGLKRNPHITLIEEDHKMEAVDIEYENVWGVTKVEAEYAHTHTDYELGNKGVGVKIGIIDSGINYNHPELAPNYAGGYDFYFYDDKPMDVYGHGTHVAGTACAALNGGATTDPKLGVVGVAPECDLYSLRVLNDDGVGYESDIMYAVEWALGREVTMDAWGDGLPGGSLGEATTTISGIRMDIINLSLGRDGAYSVASELTFAEAAEEGLVIVAAAGNSGNVAGRGENTIYPARYESVIAVGATNINDDRATFSSTGPEVELAAPGEMVYSTWNDNTGYYEPGPVCRVVDGVADVNDCYKYGSGTSMASPHVAGVAALLISSGLVSDLNGNGSVGDEVRIIMQETAIDLGTAERDERFGYGLVNIRLALDSLIPPVPVATGDIEGYVLAEGGAAIVDATVSLGVYSTVTDEIGYYIIEDIEAGDYTVLAEASTYSNETYNVSIVEDVITDISFVLVAVPELEVEISLSATGYKVRGVNTVGLTWTSNSTQMLNVIKNEVVIDSVESDGSYANIIGKRILGTFTYKLCEDTTEGVCSNEVTVTF